MSVNEDLLQQLNALTVEDKAKILEMLSPKTEIEPADVRNHQNGARNNSERGACMAPPPMVVFPPRLSMFSGDEVKDTKFIQWKAEVEGLLKENHSDASILHAMRRSTRSTAADVLMQLPTQVTVPEALKCLTERFGCVYSSERSCENFYTAHQETTESAVAWACRLEKIVGEIRVSDDKFTEEMCQNMLRNRFWSGLRSRQTREALRYRLDGGATFPQLLVAARQIEAEHEKKEDKVKSSLLQETKSSEMSEILKTLQSLNKRMEEIERHQTKTFLHRPPERMDRYRNRDQRNRAQQFNGKCFRCRQRGHRQADCNKPLSGNDDDRP